MATLTGDPDPSASWAFIAEGAQAQPARPRAVSGSAVTLAVTDPALANQGYDCLWARTGRPREHRHRAQPPDWRS